MYKILPNLSVIDWNSSIEKSCFWIFVVLLEATKEARDLSSDEIAATSYLKSATVIQHSNNLIATGIVKLEKNRYTLRTKNLAELVDYINKVTEKCFKELNS